MLKPRPKSASSPHRDNHSNADDSVCWTATVHSSNRRMLERQDGCDITFIVKGPGDPTETKFGAHRYVLCSRSQFLYRQLQWGSGKAPTDKKLKEHDIPAEAFRQLLRFMYCDETSLTLLNAVQVLQGARKYQLSALAQRCLEFVEASLVDDEVCTLLEQCVSFSEESLIDTCLRYIENHTAPVLQSTAFIRLGTEVLQLIVALETLDISELDLFNACVAWAHAAITNAAAIGSPLKSKPSAITGQVLRKRMEPLLPLIRFPTMTTNEFATYVVPLNILTDSETCNVYKYFTCPEKPVKWFQTARRKRPTRSRTTVEESVGGLYPDLDGAKSDEEKARPTPTAPDILSGSSPELDRPPRYEEHEISEYGDTEVAS